MIHKIAIVLLSLLMFFATETVTLTRGTGLVSAEEVTTRITLTKEQVVKLAANNSIHVKIAGLKLAASEAQLIYLKSQKKQLENMSIVVPGGSLPVLPDYFLQQIPNYDELSEEEKERVDQVITTQILINQSLNALLNVQATNQTQVNHRERERQ